MQKGKRSNRWAADSAAHYHKKSRLFFIIVAFFLSTTWYISQESLPSRRSPILLYSSQDGSDLKRLYLRAIESTKDDLFLVIYGLADEDIIEALRTKIENHLKIKILFDPTGSKKLERWLPKESIEAIYTSGLMHKKVLCIDDSVALLGSANLTETSLRLHDNLVAGFYDEGLIKYLKEPTLPFYTVSTKEQSAEVWSLPQHTDAPIQKIKNLILNAKDSIRICMFTFTHKEICQALKEAAMRGVKVEVALDGYTADGSSKNIAASLEMEGIFLHKTRRGRLLHHKWCLIDEKILIMGSTNWTKAAFKKNHDNIIILEPLTKKQIKTLSRTWSKTVKGL